MGGAGGFSEWEGREGAESTFHEHTGMSENAGEVDSDGDGAISFAEFEAICRGKI